MITGFEDYTHTMTPYEMDVVLPAILRGMKTKIGKDNTVTCRAIVDGLDFNGGIKTSQPRVRHILHWLRVTKTLKNCCANSKGYWIAVNKGERDHYKKGLKERIENITNLYNSFD